MSLVKNSPINLDQNNFLSSPHFILHPSITSSYIVSGGIDSSLVASTTFAHPSANQNYLTLTFGDKDFAANSAQDLISSNTCLEHYIKNVSIAEYTEALQESLLLSLSPLSTHSVPSALILGKMAFSLGSRVIYGGDGADEMYLGYPQYLTIFNSQRDLFNCSPYSSYECDAEIQKLQLMHLFDDAQVHKYDRSNLYSEYSSLFEQECGFPAKEAAIKATLLLDIRYNLHSSALLANDIMISHSSVEPRSPFVSIYHLVNMLKAPIEFPLSRTKPVLTKHFEKIFSSPAPVKQGFSGYPNESALELLRSSNPFLGNISDIYHFDFASVFSEMSRRLQWKVLNSELFLLS